MPNAISNARDAAKFADDIKCIRQQCGVPLQAAVDLYNKCQQDVVLAISSHFDASLTRTQKPLTPASTETQAALSTLRNIANAKDRMMMEIMTQQRRAGSTTEPLPTAQAHATGLEEAAHDHREGKGREGGNETIGDKHST